MTGSLISPALRERVRGLATPIATGFGHLGLTPNALSLIGFAGTCVAAFAAAAQAWALAGILVLAFGIFDLFDGTLARATGRATRFGAFLDSTLDRAGEAIVYLGIAIGSLAAGFEAGAIVAAAAMAAAFLVSYVRAKAESLGYASGSGLMNVGLAPREVRVAVLALGLIALNWFGPIGPTTVDCPADLLVSCVPPDFYLAGDVLLASALSLITVLSIITVIQRILHVRAQAKEG